MYSIRDSGWIEVIAGSMFSGKSEELIRRVKRAKIARQTVQVFKPMLDNRYSEEEVVSHNGEKARAVGVDSAAAVLAAVRPETEVVAIDEVQFFDEEIVKVCSWLANMGKRVIVAGLDQDFRGEPFGSVPVLLALAEYVTKLQAICVKCGNPASRTQRLVNGRPAAYDDPVILVGAQEHYEARCRRCHEVPRVDKPARKDAGSGTDAGNGLARVMAGGR